VYFGSFPAFSLVGKEGGTMKRLSLYMSASLLALGMAMLPAHAQDRAKGQAARERMAGPGQDRIAREVRHELVMLPYYGVFDNLVYRVDGSTVTLLGQVTRPTLKSDAENVVKSIEGVERVNNQIVVLPLSSMDDRIRLAVYRSIFSQPGLDRYAMQAVPPIHIIVDNGKVTLEGVVGTQADKDRANIQANSVTGVFSVVNNLRVEGRQ
jgi:hyperosmotically inducible protein